MSDWDSFANHWKSKLDEQFNAACEETDTSLDIEKDPDEIHTLNVTEYIRSMDTTKDGGFQATLKPRKIRSSRVGQRPTRGSNQNRCLCAMVEINGVDSFALFDSGSTADALSPDFARIAHTEVFQLENPVTLQLGTKGSRSRISYGCYVPYRLHGGKDHGDVSGKDYMDIANVDRYDVVLGTVFMRKHGIALDFENNTIRVKGKKIPTLTEEEEHSELARRYAKTVSSTIHIKDGEEIPVKHRPNKYGTVESEN